MIAAATLAALVLLAGTSDRTGRIGALLLAAVSVLWLLVNDPMEGRVIVFMTSDHGLTGADLAGFAGLGIACWRLASPVSR